MSSPTVRFGVGSLVYGTVADDRGHTKVRPLLIIAMDEGAAEAVVVCLSTSETSPAPEHCVELPWAPNGSCPTRLKQRTVAVCNWLRVMPFVDLRYTGGFVSAGHLAAVMAKVDTLPDRS
jgi:mRNA-degrading endonuclease toxin of MazEF toxin-antitoxin module